MSRSKVEVPFRSSSTSSANEVLLILRRSTTAIAEKYYCYGALYYNEVKRREVVSISDSLRRLTQRCADKMRMTDVVDTGPLLRIKQDFVFQLSPSPVYLQSNFVYL